MSYYTIIIYLFIRFLHLNYETYVLLRLLLIINITCSFCSWSWFRYFLIRFLIKFIHVVLVSYLGGIPYYCGMEWKEWKWMIGSMLHLCMCWLNLSQYHARASDAVTVSEPYHNADIRTSDLNYKLVLLLHACGVLLRWWMPYTRLEWFIFGCGGKLLIRLVDHMFKRSPAI